MIQGDEPILEPRMINQVVNIFKKDKSVQISNLYTVLKKSKEIMDPNRVKVVLGGNNNAVYFSREKISTKLIKGKKIYYKQGNVFCFNKKALNFFVKLKTSNLEVVESVDMNRLIDNHYKIKMIKTTFNTINVDNFTDFKKAKKKLEKDKYLNLYSKNI